MTANRGDCPLGPLQQRVDDPVPLFELILPRRAARLAVPVLGVVTAGGLVLLHLRGALEAAGEAKQRFPYGKLYRVNEAERRAQIQRFWESTGSDPDVSHEIYHDDAVLEFPQSGERFEGVANFKEWRNQYPAEVALTMGNLRGQGSLWVVEGSISYDGGPPQPVMNILEFRGDKVARETIYVTERWDAPEWRARWRAAP